MRHVLALLVFVAPAPLMAQERSDTAIAGEAERSGFEISTGFEYESGEYGTGSEIEKLVVPVTAKGTFGRVRASAQLPWVRVTAPENVVAPTGPLGLPILIDPDRPATRRTREGIGDLRIGLAYDLPTKGVAASLRSGVKVPTASVEKGLGTGEIDYHAGFDLSARVGALVPFTSVTYTIPGDTPRFELDDTVSAQAGAGLRLGQSTAAHIGYSYTESASDGVADDQRVFAGLNTAVGRGVSLGVYGSGGLSAGAADVGAGLSIGVALD